jgi:hypothetical protein
MIPKLKLAHFLIQSNSLLEATKNRGKKKKTPVAVVFFFFFFCSSSF